MRGNLSPVDRSEIRGASSSRLVGASSPDPQRLSLLIFRGIEGDWRDWPAIAHWAHAIADSLAGDRAATTEG